MNTTDAMTNTHSMQPRPWHLVVFATLLAIALGSWVTNTVDENPTSAGPTVRSTEREVSFTSADGTRIAGSLSLPPGPGPFPAVVAISGAGVQDRDGMYQDPDKIRLWPDLLAAAGVALLRTDDRGIGASGGDSLSAGFNELAEDAEAAVTFLSRQPEIAAERIGLLGASMGAEIAGMVATRQDNIAFVILKSGPGLPARQIIFRQMADILSAEGLPEETIEAILDIIRQAFHWLIDAPVDEVTRREKLRPLVEGQRRLQRTDPFFSASSTAASIDSELDVLLSPGYRDALRHDPTTHLSRIRCPVLVLHGELDLQVDPKFNLPAVEAALETAPTRDVTVVLFPKLNHFLQQTETGKLSEYSKAPLSPKPPRRAAAWIAERFVR